MLGDAGRNRRETAAARRPSHREAGRATRRAQVARDGRLDDRKVEGSSGNPSPLLCDAVDGAASTPAARRTAHGAAGPRTPSTSTSARRADARALRRVGRPEGGATRAAYASSPGPGRVARLGHPEVRGGDDRRSWRRRGHGVRLGRAPFHGTAIGLEGQHHHGDPARPESTARTAATDLVRVVTGSRTPAEPPPERGSAATGSRALSTASRRGIPTRWSQATPHPAPTATTTTQSAELPCSVAQQPSAGQARLRERATAGTRRPSATVSPTTPRPAGPAVGSRDGVDVPRRRPPGEDEPGTAPHEDGQRATRLHERVPARR